MNSTTHYENANFLREMAESLPRILPEGSTEKSALLQRLANEELARAKVAAARADKRPGMSSAQLRQQLQGRYQELRNEL
ncbi:plasmid stabilization protein [Escherichia coli]|nr:plasmid stabilization protein [Escherichia coli]EFO3787652.1 plasmid stabilization protein [Escherichia coli]EFO3793346.1 plasmid stabilization protein [Escherichia coli]EIQ2080003.1 plasmid stabilization protein [Escherichia coli]MDF1217179.1 plasmid stabilization protein [Escherichia coli]